MRTFERTHPWLTFRVDLSHAPAELWILLGECQSICSALERIPLRPETAERISQMYLAKGAHATTAIEGNTLSEEEVGRRLRDELRLPPSREYLGREVDNVVGLCRALVDFVAQGREPRPLEPDQVLAMNASLLNGLDLEEGVKPGEIRNYDVVVGRYRGAPPEDCRHLLDRLRQWLESEAFQPTAGREVVMGFLKAALAHLYLAWIHPFGDGNGRVARMIEYQILIQSGVPASSAHVMSNHYNQTRTQYYRELDRASRSVGDVEPFLLYAALGFRDGLAEQADFVLKQVQADAWRNHVHQAFGDTLSKTQSRQRHLVLDLSEKTEPVEIDAIPTLTPRLARAYHGGSGRKLNRDLVVLLARDLIAKTEGGRFRPRREKMLAFLPVRSKSAAG
jgi:Fic family protein